MTTIQFVSSITTDDSFLKRKIAFRLSSRGYVVTTHNLSKSNPLSDDDLHNILQSEVIIVFLPDSIDENTLKSIVSISNEVLINDSKLFISLQNEKNTAGYSNDILTRGRVLKYKNVDSSTADILFEEIVGTITSFFHDKSLQELSKNVKENIAISKPKFIRSMTEGLKIREKSLKSNAIILYRIGFISILIGVGVAILSTYFGVGSLSNKTDWSILTLHLIKTALVIILLISLSKYSFNLAKSYMSESIRVADRLHAISFGEFYLEIFKEQITSAELQEVFKDWNINNQSNSFTTQSADFDLKSFEKVLDLIDKFRDSTKSV